ncbi:MAG TPA: hypothetical protein VMM35_03805 [Longimicrobiales bacterium]|nr:hypothetical protein [Longimicrobiales bacterium]
MSLHDEYARRTPFEIAFPDRSVLERLSADVAEEVEGRGDDSLLEAFMTTTAVGERVRDMRGPDAPPESGYPLAALLYHAVHFLRAGAPLYLLDTEVTRQLVAPEWPGSEPGADARAPEPLASAGYLQLPQHLVWVEGSSPAVSDGGARRTAAGGSGAASESLDGLFWTVTGSDVLNVLPVSGLLPDRPGFGALPLPPAPLADAHIWLEATVRPGGEDFASTLPGGELDRLYGVRAAGEVLKLLARFFAVVTTATRGVGSRVRLEARAPKDAAPDRSAGAPPSSRLPYTRVSLTG